MEITLYKKSNILILLLILFSLMISSCGLTDKTIKIGFVGSLTGRVSDLGIAGRNGVMLAVNEANKKGGINGKKIILIIKDDKNDEETALRVDQELISEKVVAIIGHMTSSMAIKTVPLMNEKKMLMISPTVSTNELTGIDDYFIRGLETSIRADAEKHAEYIINNTDLRKIACIYDESNKAYSKGLYNSFRSKFTEKVLIIESEI